MKLFTSSMSGLALLLSQGALASEFTHEPIHVLCTEVHNQLILEAGINPQAGFFGLKGQNGWEVDVHHDIHQLSFDPLQTSTVSVNVLPFPQGPGVKAFTAVGVENHFAYDNPPTRRPPHFVGSKVITLKLVNRTGNSLEIAEASIAQRDAQNRVIRQQNLDFSRFRLPSCQLQLPPE